MKRYRTATYL